MTSTDLTSPHRAQLLDSRRVSEEIKAQVTREVSTLIGERGIRPCLVAVRVGEDPASEVYVRNKISASREIGLLSEHLALPVTTTTDELLELITVLNARHDVDGILVQLPLPRGVEEMKIIEAINPDKDVDGFHPINVGRLALGRPTIAPCTPSGIIELLLREGVEIEGKLACVVGRSNIVGKPMAQLLLRHNATVTVCHSRTQSLAKITRQADILIAAIGRPAIITGEHIKPGATVVDVGMNKIVDEREVPALFDTGGTGGDEAEARIRIIRKRGYTLIGDVHPSQATRVAARLTPVPGGVGLLTVAMLMRNTVTAAKLRRG
ncbi:MAG: bifunctional 5,10-methylenetetrahydrofolate dehydrogenase/5,10-methenyltetrahydrofolate cyclohydrolase [Pyrinomonadaceae bacterium]